MSDHYNGWTNRESWTVGLHLGNDYDVYQQVREIVDNNPKNAEKLKDWLEDEMNCLFYPQPGDRPVPRWVSLLASDLSPLWRVDWEEVARSFCEEDDDEPAPDAHLDDWGD